MDDDKLLKELHAQRELIQEHLRWLDQKIAALDRNEKHAAKAPDEISPQTHVDAAEKVVETVGASEASPPKQEEEELDEEFGRYKAPTANEIQRAKIGCLILFTLSTLLFLFLIFGLPYLVDW